MLELNWSSARLAVSVLVLVLSAPYAARAASIASLKQFRITEGSDPFHLTPGSDGNIWFTETDNESPTSPIGSAIGRITPGGDVAEFTACDTCNTHDIAQGPGGVLYFTTNEGFLGRITTAGELLEIEPTPNGINPDNITADGDALWFTAVNSDSIWRYDVLADAFTEFPLPTQGAGAADVAVDAGGIVWITEFQATRIARLDPADGSVVEFPVPSGGFPRNLAIAPDGMVWFTERFNNAIGRLDPTTGTITETVLPAGSGPEDIAVAVNGDVWFTQSVADNVGRITANGVYGETKSVRGSVPFGITLGHDGTSVWYAMTDADRIGLLAPR